MSKNQPNPEVIKHYVDEGMKIAMSLDKDFDPAEVKRITDEHRVACGESAADFFEVYDSPFAAMKANSNLKPYNGLYGSFDAHWLMGWKYVEEQEGDTSQSHKLKGLMKIAEHVGWFWMSSNGTVVTHKPVAIRTITKPSSNSDSEEVVVLHSYDHMALEYKDGQGVYAINGVLIMPKYSWVVTTPVDQLDPKLVMNIENTEIRTEAIKKLGPERLFDLLDKQTLDTDELNPGGKYELFNIDFGGHRRVYLRGNCPSSGDMFMEAVPPTIATCKHALAWREFGTVDIEYHPPAMRT